MSKNRSMRVLFGAFIVLAPLFAAAESGDYSDYNFARLNFVSGEVSVQRASDLGTEKAEVNLPLVEGDKLLTRDGQAEVQFGRRNFLRIDAFAQVEFVALPSESDGRIKVHLLEGRAYLRVGSLGEEKSVEVHSPDASFFVLDEGLYRFEVDADNKTEIIVREGSVEAAGEGGSVLVKAVEKLAAARGEFLSDPEIIYARSDGFDQWNESRDEIFARRSVSAYLPSDISEYEEELSDNGRWVYEQPYGNVWVPRVHHIDWRPYHFGRWSWYPVIGWTWISSEPWGWCTSHYGRWHWRINLGWYWIPRTHWGPAWVHWYSDHNYVGWCPLSYYDRPVIIVGNYFYGRNRDPYYPINSRALTMVRRDQLQSPAISRNALAASQINSLGRINLRAEQPAIRPVIANSPLRSTGSGPALNGTGSRVIRSYGINSSLASKGALSSSSSSSRIRNIPSSARRSTFGTGTSSQAGEAPGAGKGYPSRIRKDETQQSTIREYSSGAKSRILEGRTGQVSRRVSSYPSSYSSLEGRRESYPSSSRSSTSPYSSSRSSGSYSFRDSSPGLSPSYRRSYSPPSRSNSNSGSYSSLSRSSSSGSTYSAPSRSYSAPSHGSSSSRISASSRGLSSSRSSGFHSSSSSSSASSSSARSGRIRKQ